MTSSNGHAGREQLLGNIARRFDEFEVPGFEHLGTWRIQSLTERERSAYEAGALSSKGVVTKDRLMMIRRRLIVLMLVDGEGNRLLRDEDTEALEGIDSALTGAIYTRCVTHAGFDAADVEELEKNSEAIRVE